MRRPRKEEVFWRFEGLRVAAALADVERYTALSRTPPAPAESLRRFEGFCSMWRPLRREEQRALDSIKLRHLLRVRQAFEGVRDTNRHG